MVRSDAELGQPGGAILINYGSTNVTPTASSRVTPLRCMQASTNDILRAELAAGGAPSASLRLQAASVEAYLEYRRIVGDADGGTLFTEAEYAAYRAGAQQRAAARLYVHWRSAAGVDCKAVGPESQCECGHRFREHARPGAGGDEAAAGGAPQQPLRCRAARCACPGYAYLPAAGTWAAKCGCKHAAGLHGAPLRARREESSRFGRPCLTAATRPGDQALRPLRVFPIRGHVLVRVRAAVGGARHRGGGPARAPRSRPPRRQLVRRGRRLRRSGRSHHLLVARGRLRQGGRRRGRAGGGGRRRRRVGLWRRRPGPRRAAPAGAGAAQGWPGRGARGHAAGGAAAGARGDGRVGVGPAPAGCAVPARRRRAARPAVFPPAAGGGAADVRAAPQGGRGGGGRRSRWAAGGGASG